MLFDVLKIAVAKKKNVLRLNFLFKVNKSLDINGHKVCQTFCIKSNKWL